MPNNDACPTRRRGNNSSQLNTNILQDPGIELSVFDQGKYSKHNISSRKYLKNPICRSYVILCNKFKRLPAKRRKTIILCIVVGSILLFQCMYMDIELISMSENNATTETAKPRSVSMYGDPNFHVQQLDEYAEKYPSKRQVMSKSSLDRQSGIKNSKKYRKPELDSFITSKCEPMYDWQITSFPTCNKLHEIGLFNALIDDDSVKIINHGFFRDVWTLHDSGLVQTQRALKTLRYEHAYVDSNYDRHRRDAVAMERLTSSPYIVDIYGFCGNNGVFEFSTGGDIDHALFTKKSLQNPLIKYDRLRIAAQVASGIADAHYFDELGRPTIAHTDITGGQFIFIDGVFKLNDFNRARFIRWNAQKNETCGFKVGANRGDFRAPEEYSYAIENEKVDVYSMGNIFYQLSTLKYFIFGDSENDIVIAHKVINGERPPFLEDIGPDPDQIDKVFIQAMEMCFVHNPRERPSAREVAKYIFDSLQVIPYPKQVANSSASV